MGFKFYEELNDRRNISQVAVLQNYIKYVL